MDVDLDYDYLLHAPFDFFNDEITQSISDMLKKAILTDFQKNIPEISRYNEFCFKDHTQIHQIIHSF